MRQTLSPDPSLYKIRKQNIGSILAKRTSIRLPDLDILDGLDSTFVEKRYLLLDVNAGFSGLGTGEKTLLGGLSLTGIPESDDLFLADPTHIYLFPKRDGIPGVLSVNSDNENIPFLSLAKDESISPELNFFVEEFESPSLVYVASTDSIRVDYTVGIAIDGARDTGPLGSWSWSYFEPDGTQIYLDRNKEKVAGAVWLENSIPVDYFGIQEGDFDLTLSMDLKDLARFIDPVLQNIRHHFLIKLEFKTLEGTSQEVLKLVEFPVKQAKASYRFALPWAEEGDYLDTGGTVKPQAYHLQPRVTHGDPDAETLGNAAAFETSGAFRDLHLAFDLLGDNSLSIHASNSREHSSYTAAAKTAANSAAPFSDLYRVYFHRDYYTCDFERGEILMAEKYDSIAVRLGE
jgi:hypothetical protein